MNDINAEINEDNINQNNMNDISANDIQVDTGNITEIEINNVNNNNLNNVLQPPPEMQNNNNNNGQGNNTNQLGAVRDRLFHAMLVRVALKYSSRVNLSMRRLIEGSILVIALLLLSSLLFIHIKFTRTTTTCLDSIKPEWIREGVVRVEVVKNLHVLEEHEAYIRNYVERLSIRTCTFNPADIFKQGPRVINNEIRKGMAERHLRKNMKMNIAASNDEDNQSEWEVTQRLKNAFNWIFRLPFDYVQHDESHSEIIEEIDEDTESAYEQEAISAWEDYFKLTYHPDDNFEYMYRVEYAYLYGVLRLPPTFREKHGIKTAWIRIDAESKCFGDTITRAMMKVIGYEDSVISSLRQHALNYSINGDSNSMGYLHDLDTHEHYHFVTNVLGKTSYLTAAFLMFLFTFAISMLLRFSHHQIFIFIIDLLHMFEVQQPLYFPVAPIFTVILALVGMETIMSEVFNDTTTAFYVILIVWVADQFDAICCHSDISKRLWLQFFYLYQFFFYAYQYRFGGQYGNLALWTSAMFILHSMVFFFHHYEIPLILYQDRVQHVLADLQAPQNEMGTVEVQTITVAVHARYNQNAENSQRVIRESTRMNASSEVAENMEQDNATGSDNHVDNIGSLLPEERVAEQIVRNAMNELFNSNE